MSRSIWSTILLLPAVLLLFILPHTRIHAISTRTSTVTRRSILQPFQDLQKEWNEPFFGNVAAGESHGDNNELEPSLLEIPIHLMHGKQTAAQRRAERANARCPRHYVFDSIEDRCKCPTGTSGMARASPSDATLHEHAEQDFRCCRAMKMAPTCTMPCCFCIETIVPWLKPHDCESTTALRQAAWWRKKKLHHTDVSKQVQELRRKLEEAKREEEEKLHPHTQATLPAPVVTPVSATPSTKTPLASSTSPPAAASSATTTESQVNKDVKSGFLSSLLHP